MYLSYLRLSYCMSRNLQLLKKKREKITNFVFIKFLHCILQSKIRLWLDTVMAFWSILYSLGKVLLRARCNLSVCVHQSWWLSIGNWLGQGSFFMSLIRCKVIPSFFLLEGNASLQSFPSINLIVVKWWHFKLIIILSGGKGGPRIMYCANCQLIHCRVN